MSHTANEHDQFTPMNTDGTTVGLPTANGYPHRDAADQAPLINPSAGESSPAGGGVNPMGPANHPGSLGPHSTNQVFPDTTVGYPN